MRVIFTSSVSHTHIEPVPWSIPPGASPTGTLPTTRPLPVSTRATLFDDGSVTQRSVPSTTRPLMSSFIGMVVNRVLWAGSTLATVLSDSSSTHTAPAPNVTRPGDAPVCTMLSRCPVVSSMRTSPGSAPLDSHTAPPPIAIAPPEPPTWMGSPVNALLLTSIRTTLPSSSATHTSLSEAAMPVGVPFTSMLMVFMFDPGSILLTVLSPASDVHTEPAPNAMSRGVPPTLMIATVWLVAGSMRITFESSVARTQPAPAPTTTPNGVPGTLNLASLNSLGVPSVTCDSST